MLVVGVDLHKHSHTCAVVNGVTGESRGYKTIDAVGEGFAQALNWVKEHGDVVWVLEDCRHVSAGFEAFLLQHDQRVLRVAPHLTAQGRKSSRQRGKSDQIDALMVARVALREGLNHLPKAVICKRSLEIKALVDHRENIVCHRTRQQNRLRDHLHRLWPEFKLPAGCLDRKKWLTQINNKLALTNSNVFIEIAKQLTTSIQEATQTIRDLNQRIETLVDQHAPRLLNEPGCGPITAARIIAETGQINRFKTDAQLARLAATAPIPASSGNKTRNRLDRGGNRKLNNAIYRIAITKIRIDQETKNFITRQTTTGKTKKEAIRTLKRYITRRIYKLLTTPTKTPQTATTKTKNMT